MVRETIYSPTTTASQAKIEKWCSVCKRTGHYASEHENWEKINGTS